MTNFPILPSIWERTRPLRGDCGERAAPNRRFQTPDGFSWESSDELPLTIDQDCTRGLVVTVPSLSSMWYENVRVRFEAYPAALHFIPVHQCVAATYNAGTMTAFVVNAGATDLVSTASSNWDVVCIRDS